MNCPEPVVTSGWTRDDAGRRYAIDACAEHAWQRPMPEAPGVMTAPHTR